MKEAKYLSRLESGIKERHYHVYDLETTTDLERVYLVGFASQWEYRFFESEPKYPEQSGSPVDQFLRWLFAQPNLVGDWFYAHNAGNFDVLYLVRWLLEHESRFRVEVVPLQSSVLMLTVVDKESNPKRPSKWTFVDSLRLMSSSLDKLGKAFGLGGKVEDVNYDTLHLDPRRYEYLRRDCELLYACLGKFYSMIHEIGGNVGVTAPATAMLTFRRRFLKKPIPINQHFEGCKCETE